MPGDGAIQKSVIKERLIDRLQAMSATNRAITNSMGGGVRLLDLIDSAIHGFESRFDITGSPGLALGPQMTQNFSLGLHELLTNALKYGALSVPEGRLGLQLDWTSFVLTFVWQERGGRPAAAGFRQPHPRRFRQKLLRECADKLRAGLFPLLAAKSGPTKTDWPNQASHRPQLRIPLPPQPPSSRRSRPPAPRAAPKARHTNKPCCTTGRFIKRARKSVSGGQSSGEGPHQPGK